MTDHKLTPREPTDAMVLAGDAALPDNPDEHDAVSVWRAMHDAAPDKQERLSGICTAVLASDRLCNAAVEFCRWVPDSGSAFEDALRDAARAYLKEHGYE